MVKLVRQLWEEWIPHLRIVHESGWKRLAWLLQSCSLSYLHMKGAVHRPTLSLLVHFFVWWKAWDLHLNFLLKMVMVEVMLVLNCITRVWSKWGACWEGMWKIDGDSVVPGSSFLSDVPIDRVSAELSNLLSFTKSNVLMFCLSCIQQKLVKMHLDPVKRAVLMVLLLLWLFLCAAL